ncbi:MAG: hypothetical protein KDD41_07890 [Flavobacteriales bacterium]|nr:hypothetical protein [Flavobacteriales bacterium]
MHTNFIKKKLVVAFILLFAFTVGYIRETIFVVINSVINDYAFPYNPSYLEPPAFLYDIETGNLIKIKWFLTFVFSLIFFGITLWLVNFYFRSKSYNRIILLTYSILFAASLIITLLGFLFNQYESFYGISRFIAGLLQYPLMTLILFTMFYFVNQLYRE